MFYNMDMAINHVIVNQLVAYQIQEAELTQQASQIEQKAIQEQQSSQNLQEQDVQVIISQEARQKAVQSDQNG